MAYQTSALRPAKRRKPAYNGDIGAASGVVASASGEGEKRSIKHHQQQAKAINKSGGGRLGVVSGVKKPGENISALSGAAASARRRRKQQ
jgi:hypothetical protein